MNRILFVACEKAPEVRQVKFLNSAYLKKLLGGNYKVIQPFSDKSVALVIREPELGEKKLPLNRFLINSEEVITSIVRGDFMVVGYGQRAVKGLENEYVIKKWLEYYKIPTFFNNSDGSVLMNTSTHIKHRIYRHLRLKEDSDRKGVFFEDLISNGCRPIKESYEAVCKSYLEPGSVIYRLLKVRDFEVGDVLEVTAYDKECRQQTYYYFFNGEAEFKRFEFDRMYGRNIAFWLRSTLKDGISALMDPAARSELSPDEMRHIIASIDPDNVDYYVTDDGYVCKNAYGKLYEGVKFVPHRDFTDLEKKMAADLAKITHYFNFTWDFKLGMFDEKGAPPGHKQKHKYNHDEFFEAMGDAASDIYYCVDTGDYYIPCTHTMMKITKNIFV